jgi:formylglycine-generating enzyme required for sulfatase activity
MELAPGRYRYKVTQPGFKGHQGVVELADHDVVERVELAPGWKSGETFKDCNECPEMVAIPAGSFLMGSPSSEQGRENDESPQHRVTISQPFALGKYEVTFDEYDVFARATGKSLPDDKGWGRGRRPVINVSWEDAQAYAKWLSQQTGERYRLPSEAEWEYAARAGTPSAYWWDNSIGSNRANCYGCGSRWDSRQTAPAGSFSANGFGLFDVHGNVWEWTEDCWNGSYSGAPADGSAWTRGDCGRRVLRGGSWFDVPRSLRAALRFGYTPSVRDNVFGFRLARTL